jgi:WD40 repeat protein
MLADINDVPLLVTGGENGTIWMWRIDTGEAFQAPIEAHSGAVTSLTTGEWDGQRRLLSAGADGSIKIWVITAAETFQAGRLLGHIGAVDKLKTAKLEDRTILISVGSDRTVRVWDLATRRCLFVIATIDRPRAIEVSDDTMLIASKARAVCVNYNGLRKG